MYFILNYFFVRKKIIYPPLFLQIKYFFSSQRIYGAETTDAQTISIFDVVSVVAVSMPYSR